MTEDYTELCSCGKPYPHEIVPECRKAIEYVIKIKKEVKP
jgi:hypothetical protein